MQSNTVKTEVVDKGTLAKIVARKKCTTIYDATLFIDTFISAIIESVREDKKIQINDFLSFNTSITKEKKMVSALDKKEYVVPPKRVVKITIGKGFKQAIQNGYKESEKL